MGSAGWLEYQVLPPLIIAPIIILTIALAHAIHILSIALSNMNEGMQKDKAIIESMKINFMPVFLTSFTTAVGVAGVNFGNIPAFSQMANAVVFGAGRDFVSALITIDNEKVGGFLEKSDENIPVDEEISQQDIVAVSYTHLTLPTILLV